MKVAIGLRATEAEAAVALTAEATAVEASTGVEEEEVEDHPLVWGKSQSAPS